MMGNARPDQYSWPRACFAADRGELKKTLADTRYAILEATMVQLIGLYEHLGENQYELPSQGG